MSAKRPALVLFAIMVAHSMLETARDALLLAKMGPGTLAWVYLGMAALAMGVFMALGRVARTFDPRRMLLGFLGSATLGTAALAIVLPRAPWLSVVLYMWAGLVATIVVPTFWTLLDRSPHAKDAKRMFAAIGAGGVLGALVGSGAAALICRAFPARTLVPVAACMYAIAAIVAAVLTPRPVTTHEALDTRPPADPPPGDSRRYLRVLLWLGVASTIALTLGDLVFKRALADRVPARDLATAFGAIYAGLNVCGLVIQVLVTPRLLARWGVGGALVVLPLIMAASSFGFAATGALMAAVLLKLGDGSLRYSLHRVGAELLFLPVPADLRDRSKPVIDALGLRGGQAAAALLVLGLGLLGGGARLGGAVAAVIAAVWLVGAIFARRAYVDAFRGTLKASEPSRNATVPVPDDAAMAILADSLASPDELEAIAALDLLARHRRVPALVLYHPVPGVVRRALALMRGSVRPDVARVLGKLQDHPDPSVRAAALAAASRTHTNRDQLSAGLVDDEPEVRAAAAIELAGDAELGARAGEVLAALERGGTDEHAALAHAIATSPDARFRELVAALLARGEPHVCRTLLRLCAQVPALLDPARAAALLADPHVRGEARRALAATGEAGLALATEALDDPRTPLDVRRQLPRTIASFRSQAAANALAARLLREPDGTTEFKILRALGRMAPHVPIDAAPIRTYVQRAVADAARYGVFASLMAQDTAAHPGDASAGLLEALLDEKRALAVERAFRALGILHPSDELRVVYDALVDELPDRRSAAVEVLEGAIPVELRGPLIALAEPALGAADAATSHPLAVAQAQLAAAHVELLAALGKLAPGPFESAESLAAALLDDPSESVRCVAAHHVASRELVGLRADLLRLRPLAASPFVTFAFDQAIARLDARR
ncbi:MAG TPA: hypothetical protein VGM88_08765 [Kofleriaceae bacterium]|jgi:ATP/ADP translocase